MPHKPLILDPKTLRPLPQSLWGLSCAWCDKTQARWELSQPDILRKAEPICSLCWLYDSDWGRQHRHDIDLMIQDIEIECGSRFARLEAGTTPDQAARLCRCQDGDRVLAAIAVTSRVFAYRGLMRGLTAEGSDAG